MINLSISGTNGKDIYFDDHDNIVGNRLSYEFVEDSILLGRDQDIEDQTDTYNNVLIGNRIQRINNNTYIRSTVVIGNDSKGYLKDAVVGSDAYANNTSIAIGYYAQATYLSCAVGGVSYAYSTSTSVGRYARSFYGSVAVGDYSYATNNGVAIGRLSKALNNGISIGYEVGTTYAAQNRLMIDVSDRDDPLIDGDFSERKVKINNLFVLAPTSEPANAEEGMIYYDSTAKKLKVYTGSSWETINSS